jgi:drug/metabolite transporter (DMT)-like permease
MHPTRRALLQVHLCVVLWGFTAILGKLITLPSHSLVLWRMVLVAGALLLVPAFWRGARAMSPRLVAIYAGIGVVVALHWWTFYGSIKLSNASVAATCMALSPVFISFVEPFLVKRKFDWSELVFGVAVIPGVACVVGGTPAGMRLGVAVGALSAFFVAIFASLNKRHIGQSAALSVTGIEMGAGALFLALLGLLLPQPGPLLPWPSAPDAMWLIALAVGCTLIPFALSLSALRHLSAFSTLLAVNLEPIYAMVLAILLLGEQREMTPTFYVGVAIILLVVFSHPLWTARRKLRAVSVAAAADRRDRDTSGSA